MRNEAEKYLIRFSLFKRCSCSLAIHENGSIRVFCTELLIDLPKLFRIVSKISDKWVAVKAPPPSTSSCILPSGYEISLPANLE